MEKTEIISKGTGKRELEIYQKGRLLRYVSQASALLRDRRIDIRIAPSVPTVVARAQEQKLLSHVQRERGHLIIDWSEIGDGK
jgi:hypothetical protein